MSSQIEASLGIVRVVGDSGGVLNITDAAEKADAATKVLSFAVEIESILNHVLRLKILGPPLIEGWVFKALDERLEPVYHVHFSEHSGNFGSMGFTFNVVLDGSIDFMNSFEMFCHLEMCILQVNPVVLLSNLDGFVPFAA